MTVNWEYVAFRWNNYSKMLDRIEPQAWRAHITSCRSAVDVLNYFGALGWELVGEPVRIGAANYEYTLKKQSS